MTRKFHYKGYDVIWYGESSLAIVKDGKTKMHTGSRNVEPHQANAEMLVDGYLQLTEALKEGEQE